MSLILLALCSPAAAAQVPTSEEPGHQAARFEKVEQPKATLSAVLSLPSTVAPDGAGSIIIHVTALRIVGGTVYSEAALAPLAAEVEGKDVPLAKVYGLAQELTAKYGKDGYVLSRAIVPPQDLDPQNATVTIKIVEAYIDRVEWPQASRSDATLFAAYAAKITAERPSNIKTVMRYLLLADDLPGFSVTSRFQASQTNPDASTLIVETTGKPVDAYAQFDNRGTEGRGPLEFSAGVTLNNVFGWHNALSLSYSGATTLEELQSVTAGYSQVLNSEGLMAFADVAWTWGAPGTADLQTLEFNSQSLSLDAGLSQPVIRGRDLNVTLSETVFLSNNEAQMLGEPSSDDRLRGLRLGADLDVADSWNGVTQVKAKVSQGFVGLGSSDNDNALASREHGRVDFTKIEGFVSRSQPLKSGFSVVTAAQGQYAFTPLLSPEECSYGGRNFGRAFDPAELSGDSCFSVSGELRYDPQLSVPHLRTIELYGFVDYGTVFRIAPTDGTPISDAGASAGVGLRLANDNFNADILATKPIFGRADDGWRFFLIAGARY